MAVYFVLGSILVAWGLGLAILGLVRSDFPPSGPAGRALVGVTVVIVAATLVALLVTTETEHPREEAAAEAAREKAETEGESKGKSKGKAAAPGAAPGTATSPGQAPEEQPSERPPAGAETVQVLEDEFSIQLPTGKTLPPGNYRFDVQNRGNIQHDLAIDGNGVKDAKTALIDAGGSDELRVKLKPAKYRFYCTVPGHEQAGMRLQVTVR